MFQKNLQYLKLIREKGINGFYDGKIAKLIVEQSDKNGGFLSLNDLKKYRPIERKPVEGNYKNYHVISMGPPSSGGIALIEALNILENFKIENDEWNSSYYIHKLAEALKFVYADRAKHLGDEDFYKVPKQFLLSKKYAKARWTTIDSTKATPSDSIFASDLNIKESTETTHYSIVDKFGNAVSTTVTLNSSYGNKIVVEGAGFFMNNEMDDFSAKPNTPNQFL